MSYALKFQYHGLIKRAQFSYGDASKSNDQDISDMYDIVKKLFGISKPNSEIQLSFIDEENDSITFSSNHELDAAFALVNSEGWKTLKIYVKVDSDRKEGTLSVSTEKKEDSPSTKTHVAAEKTEKAVKVKPHGTFLPHNDMQELIPEAHSKPASEVFDSESKKCDSPESNRKMLDKVEQSVPLRATSGGAYLYKDGTVEFGMGGEAVLLPDGQTVSCTLSYRGFPSVAAAGTLLTEGKWYYEAMLLTDGLMQIGWCDKKFEGNSNRGEGVGDDEHSIAYDGKRKLKWHNGRAQPFGERWKAGDVVCCAADLDQGVVKFALNGQWDESSTAFSSLVFHDGLMPAASFSKGEKLCFNFGSAPSGFVYAPPSDEFLPVYIAQGNVNTMKKMEKMMQGKGANNRSGSAGFMKPGSVPNMPPPPPYNSSSSKHGSVREDGNVSIKDKFIELLLKDDVRQALSRFLAQPEVAMVVQHLLVAVYSGSFHHMQEHISKIIPLLLKLGSEAPALLGLIPMLKDICAHKKDCPSSVCKNGADSNIGTRRSQENAYSDAHFPPPPPGVWGPRHFPPPPGNGWGAPPPPHHLHRQRKQFCKRRGKGAHWHRQNCARKWGNARFSQAAKEDTKFQPQQVSEENRESPVVAFGKMLSTALQNTGGQAMKWVGELCEPTFDEKRFSRDLQKAISQSLAENPSAFNQNSNSSDARREKIKSDQRQSNLMEKKPAGSEPSVVRPRAKFVEQYALSALDQQRVTLSAILPGEKVTQIWRMMNPSDQDWPLGVYAKSVGGDDFVIQTNKWVPPTAVSSKKEIDIVVDAIAPEKPGRYIHYWRLHDENDVPFGDRIWLDMVVVLKKPEAENLNTEDQSSQSRSNIEEATKTSSCIAEKKELEKDLDVSKSAAEVMKAPPLRVVEDKEGEDNDEKPAASEDGTGKEPAEDSSEILSTTSSGLSHPDEQWDLLHSNTFVDDFMTSSESMVQVEKFKKQLDLLSSMGFSNRDVLIKLLEKHGGDVQKVIDTFVTSA